MEDLPDFTSEDQKQTEFTLFVDRIERKFREKVGNEQEADDHIDYMRRCEDKDEVYDYLMGLADRYELSQEWISSLGAGLESNGKTE